jgi:hypothetical protein
MPRGIEADPHVLLRLELGQRRALRDRVRVVQPSRRR